MKPRRRQSFERAGEPLSYGSKFPANLPRTIAVLPNRDVYLRRLNPRAQNALRGLSAKRLSQLQLARQRLVAAPRSRNKNDALKRYQMQQRQNLLARRANPPPRPRKTLLDALRMAHPKRVLFCVKRKIRREVLFAFSRAGRKGSGPGRRGKYRRNESSQYSC